MSLDYFCYTPLKPEETEEITELLKKQYPEFFPKRYWICPVTDLRSNNKRSHAGYITGYLAGKYNFDACSEFILHWQHCHDEPYIPDEEIFNTVKQAFGPGNMLILLELDGEPK